MSGFVMNESYFSNILEVMSLSRLKRYEVFLPKNAVVTEGMAIAPYLAIQDASLWLALSFQLVEISFRNRVDNAVRKYYQNDPQQNAEEWYMWLIEDTKTRKAVSDAVERAKRDKGNNKTVSRDDIIAHITFGTWVTICQQLQKDKNEAARWRIISQLILPNLVQERQSAKEILTLIAEIQKKRNRLFHHEPVWSRNNIVTHTDVMTEIIRIHNVVLKCIKALSPELFDFYVSAGFDKRFDQFAGTAFQTCNAIINFSVKM